MSNKFSIKNLNINVGDKQIVKKLNLEISAGEIHAIMGPNGAGKSSLAKFLAGHPDYFLMEDKNPTSLKLCGTSILKLNPEERAQLGLFLAFQYPSEIPGLKIEVFLREAYRARFPGRKISALEFRKKLEALAKEFEIKEDLIKRNLNENFSGGEKKRLEILQMAVLEPKFAILDEVDSGLDIDAIKAVALGVQKIVKKHHTGVLIITHYQRILDYLTPDFVHVMKNGQIIKSGDEKLALKLEKSGYQNLM